MVTCAVTCWQVGRRHHPRSVRRTQSDAVFRHRRAIS
jgi:hypothetical protein